MKKTLILVCCALALAATAAFASRRVVLAEHATQWNCPYCPSANEAVDELLQSYWGNLAVVRYHAWWPGANNDPFYLANTTENAARINYYSIGSYGVPAHVVDGKQGDYQPNSSRINSALAVASPIDLTMTVAYDSLARTGTVTWKAKATGAVPVSNLRLRCAITESDIYAAGGTNGETLFQQVMRDMVDNATGDAVTLVNAGDSAYGTKNFSINSAWVYKNCEIVLWVQSDNVSGDQWRVLQAAKHSFAARMSMINSTASVGGKGFYQFLPGDVAQLAVTVQNQGGDGVNATCDISEDSPYLTVGNGSWNIGSLASGDTINNQSAPFTINIDTATFNGHRTPIVVTMSITNGQTGEQKTTVDTVWFIIGTPTVIFSDNFSGGWAVNWVRAGTGGVNWDTTSLQSHSASYSVTDSRTGSYANNVNRYITTINGINLSAYPAVLLSWWERYSTEEGFDYCYPYVSPQGSTWYKAMPGYSGSNTTWTKRTLDVTDYRGAGFKVRFRFISDGGVVDDGWYVDDVMVEAYDSSSSAVAGNPSAPVSRSMLMPAYPNPAPGRSRISYQLAAPGSVSLNVYDMAGRLVRTLVRQEQPAGSYSLNWDGRDNVGQPAANGVYFYRLKAGEFSSTRKLSLVR